MMTFAEIVATDQGTPGHPFQRAGLGLGPFRYVGHEVKLFQACPGAPIKAGSSCDFCPTAIADVFWIVGVDGSRFKVGSTCVGKTIGKSRDRSDTAIVREVRKVKRDATNAKADVRIAAAKETLANDDQVRVALSLATHPNAWRAGLGDTMLEQAEWMMGNAGRSGSLKIARQVEKLVKALAG